MTAPAASVLLVQPINAWDQLRRLRGPVDNAAECLGHRYGASSSSILQIRTVIDDFILPKRDLLRDKERPKP